MGKSTTARVSRKDSELTLQQHETDAPILPSAQLEHLHQFRPDAVDFVIQQTKEEAEFRRKEQRRINTFIFIEKIFGQFCALTIGGSGVCGGAWVAVQGQPWAGASIAAAALTGLAVAFLAAKKSP